MERLRDCPKLYAIKFRKEAAGGMEQCWVGSCNGMKSSAVGYTFVSSIMEVGGHQRELQSGILESKCTYSEFF